MAHRTRVGERIVRGLTEFVEALESDDIDRITEFNCHQVKLHLDPTPYSGGLVKKTRKVLGASQAVFAAFLGVSVKTVSSWEQDASEPSPMACRFMDEIRQSPAFWQQRLRDVAIAKRSPASHPN